MPFGPPASITKPARTKEQIFTDIQELAKKQTLKIGVRGFSETGKTRFCCSASKYDENNPDFIKETIPATPVYILETESGAAQLASQFPGRKIKVLNCYVSTGDPQQDCRASLELIKEAINALSDLTSGTICIDSGTDLWEWISGVLRLEILKVDLSARVQPSDYKWANAEYRSIMEKCRSIQAHFIITAMDEEVYKDAKLTTTGVYKAGWQKWTPRFLDCVIRMLKVENKSDVSWSQYIEKFRQFGLQKRDFVGLDFTTFYKLVEPYLKTAGVTQ